MAMKSTNTQLNHWAEQARARLHEIAKDKLPDGSASNRSKIRTLRRTVRGLRATYSWATIAEMLADPSIGVTIKPNTLRRIVSSRT